MVTIMDVFEKSVKTCYQSQIYSVIRQKGNLSLSFDGNRSNMNWIFLLMVVNSEIKTNFACKSTVCNFCRANT